MKRLRHTPDSLGIQPFHEVVKYYISVSGKHRMYSADKPSEQILYYRLIIKHLQQKDDIIACIQAPQSL